MERIKPAITQTDALFTTALIRWMVGLVFLSEGIQKWLDPDLRGAGRFEKIGLPSPELLGHFVGTVEILCGAILLVGWMARLAASPLLAIMIVALVSTKLPILLDDGGWMMAHAARTDFCMTVGCVFILVRGAGGFSLDRRGSRS
jgi:putative oxidoreductase